MTRTDVTVAAECLDCDWSRPAVTAGSEEIRELLEEVSEHANAEAHPITIRVESGDQTTGLRVVADALRTVQG